jgi:hypothetical protein
MNILDPLNKLANQFGYTVIPSDLWEKIQNELASVVDAIKVYESKEDNNA